jgi:hypothetical protein
MKKLIAATIVAMTASALWGAAGAKEAQPSICQAEGAAVSQCGAQNIVRKPAGTRLAQMMCSYQGQTMCMNGWFWVCQCRSFGCAWSGTSHRC